MRRSPEEKPAAPEPRRRRRRWNHTSQSAEEEAAGRKALQTASREEEEGRRGRGQPQRDVTREKPLDSWRRQVQTAGQRQPAPQSSGGIAGKKQAPPEEPVAGRETRAKVAVDWLSGRSRGFGFVTFDEKKSMEETIDEMNKLNPCFDLYGWLDRTVSYEENRGVVIGAQYGHRSAVEIYDSSFDWISRCSLHIGWDESFSIYCISLE